jgi:hypothetical protein
MRFSILSSATALTLMSAAAAQTPRNLFEIHSTCTNFTDRGILGVNAGEMLMQVHKDYFIGVGHDNAGSAANILGFQYFTQDERPVTQETYYLVVRGEAPTGGPAFPGTPVLRAGPLLTPPSASITPAAWQITATLQTPAAVPMCDTYYFGGELAAAPAWNNPPGQDDGQSFHISTYFPLGVPPTQGDNPAPGATNLTWNTNFATMLPGQPSYSICTRIGMLVSAAVLNTGNVDPTTTVPCLQALGGESYGAGGLWPQSQGPGFLRNDGLKLRVRDANNANGVFVLFLGAPFGCPGLPLSGLANGALYLNPALFASLGSASLDAAGTGSLLVLPPGSSAAPLNRFTRFQAFTVGQAFTLPGNLTNLATTRYLP